MTEQERIQAHRDAVKRHSQKFRAITIRAGLEEWQLIEAAAKSEGKSVQAYALAAVREKMEREARSETDSTDTV